RRDPQAQGSHEGIDQPGHEDLRPEPVRAVPGRRDLLRGRAALRRLAERGAPAHQALPGRRRPHPVAGPGRGRDRRGALSRDSGQRRAGGRLRAALCVLTVLPGGAGWCGILPWRPGVRFKCNFTWVWCLIRAPTATPRPVTFPDSDLRPGEDVLPDDGVVVTSGPLTPPPDSA